MREGMKGRNFLLHHGLSGWDRFFDSGSFFRQHEREQLLHPDVLAQVRNDDPMREARAWLAKATGHPVSAMQYLDLHMYLPLDILTKVDRMSMAHSLETRVPLLDHKLVEFAATIPPEMNLRGNTGKLLFKKAMTGILPASIIDRPKRGFAVPLGNWFRGELAGFARELLLSRRCLERNVLNASYVRRLLDLQRAGRPLDFHLWTLISFEMWCRTFIDAQSTRTERAPIAAGVGA
jgi:asparagine synthase (glutamine-hydrolysing)